MSEGTRSLLQGLGHGGVLGRMDLVFSPVGASWYGLCGPPSGLFSLAVILTLSFPPAGQLAWS